MYNNLLQRLKEIGVSATMTATNIQVLDRADLPKRPYSPKKARNMLLALFLGLAGGAGAVFFTEYLDNTVKDTSEIEEKMHLPSLGVIPFRKTDDPAALSVISLLGSMRMRELVEWLDERYSFIIIDSPPALDMTDSLYLSTVVDGVILVAKSGHTTRHSLSEAKKVFGQVNSKVLGVVLNGRKFSGAGYGYYYQRYYGKNGS